MIDSLCKIKYRNKEKSLLSVVINTNQLKRVLQITPENQNIMLTGKHGIGKSQILKQFFEERGQKVVILFLGQMSDPGDLIGLPRLNEETGKTDFMLPYWFPTDGKPIVLFLDELNRARPEVLQTIMDLTLNRTLAGKALPKGSRIISAVNDGEEYQLTDLDPALVSRFNIYEFKPTVSEWLVWAQKQGLDSRVLEFINENPDMLDGAEFRREDQGLGKSPDRRGWERVSQILQNNEPDSLLKTVIAGIVGMPATAKLFASISKTRNITAKDILLDSFDKVKTSLKKYKTHELATLNDSVFRLIESEAYEKSEISRIAKNLTAYFEYLETEELREIAAHFVNLFSSSGYPTAIVFIITNCPELNKRLTEFIKAL